MDIIQIAKEQNRGLVTENGRKVTILKTDCRGDHPLTGLVHSENHDRATMWDHNGKAINAFINDNLIPYNLELHFDWALLPGWANLCVFKYQGEWMYSSVEPEWSPNTKQWFVSGRETVSAPIPKAVADKILWDPISEDSLVINPKYT